MTTWLQENESERKKEPEIPHKSHAESLSKILGAVFEGQGSAHLAHFQSIWLQVIKWTRRAVPHLYLASKNGSHNFVQTFSNTLYYEWCVENGFRFVLQIVLLISDSLGGVLISKDCFEKNVPL